MSKKQKTLFQTWHQECKKNISTDKFTNKDAYSRTDTDFAESTSSNNADCSISFPDFDMDAGKTWIYPSNLSIRDYQFSIVKECLFKNTMVVLPTGLGKTFIAAVVMYNFYRWYPNGKVVFMAPTKPLVVQQRDACFQITGISSDDTVHMTGTNLPVERKHKWRTKRVFFLTPQTLANDLTRDICSAISIKCLVIDEAHKALGNHAYCEVIRHLQSYSSQFRVLALTATPGSDTDAIKQVISNLLISHIELRTEESEDVKSYIHGRDIEKIVVPLGEEISSLKSNFLDVINIYLKRLQSNKAFSARNPASLSKFQILKLKENFAKHMSNSVDKRTFGLIMADFALCISLYHAYELLLLHGVKPFYHFLMGIINGEKSIPHSRAELLKNFDFERMMEFIKGRYFSKEDSLRKKSPNNFLSSFSSEITSETDNSLLGHPKLEKLKEIVVNHFKKADSDPCTTRIIIFSQYRDSVKEIEEMLKCHHPIIRVMSFVGQASKTGSSKGITQKEQLKVVQQFREGGYNTLVATCVGEEGLDIGEVDLIICYDCPKSPIRFVQRIGRTGRKRKGRIIFLVTEGKEEHMYKSSEYQRNSILRSLKSGFSFAEFYQNCPRMIPYGVHPMCVKTVIKIEPQTSSSEGKKPIKIGRKLSAMLDDKEKSYFDCHFNVPSDNIPQLPTTKFLTLPSKDHKIANSTTSKTLSLNNWLPWQTVPQKTFIVSHSKKSSVFVDIMQLINNPSALQKYSKDSNKSIFKKVTSRPKPSVLTMLNSLSKTANTSDFADKKHPEIMQIKPENINTPIENNVFNDCDDSVSVIFDKKSDDNFLSFIDSMIALSHPNNSNKNKPTIPCDFSYLNDSKFYEISFLDLANMNSKSQNIFPKFNLESNSKPLQNEKTSFINQISNSLNFNERTTNNSVSTEIISEPLKSISLFPPLALKSIVNKSNLRNNKNITPKKSFSPKKTLIQKEFSPINNNDDKQLFKKPETPYIKSNLMEITNYDQICKDDDFYDFCSAPLFPDESLTFPKKEDMLIEPNPVSNNSISPLKIHFKDQDQHSSHINQIYFKHDKSLNKTSNEITNIHIISKDQNLEKSANKLTNQTVFPVKTQTTQCSLTQLASLVDHTQKITTSIKCDAIPISNTDSSNTNSEEEIAPTPPKNIQTSSVAFSYTNNLLRDSQFHANSSQQLNLDNEFDVDFIRDSGSLFNDDEDFSDFITKVTTCVEKNDKIIKHQSKIPNLDKGNLKGKIENELLVKDTSIKDISQSCQNSTIDLSFDIDFTQENISFDITPIKPTFKVPSPSVVIPKNKSSHKSTKTGKEEKNFKRKKTIVSLDENDDDDFKMPVKKTKCVNNPKQQNPKISMKKKKQDPETHEFVIREAEVSDDNDSKDDTDGSSLDEFDQSFIDDHACAIPDTEQHLHYLKSVKNCVGYQPQYKLKYNSDIANVYSQPVEDTEPDYMLDSFCVGNDDIVFLSSPDKTPVKKIKAKKKKRKRIVMIDSNSSSDDTTPGKRKKVKPNSPFQNQFKISNNKEPIRSVTSSHCEYSLNCKPNGDTNINVQKPLFMDLTESSDHKDNIPKTCIYSPLNITENKKVDPAFQLNQNTSIDGAENISFDISWDEPVESITPQKNNLVIAKGIEKPSNIFTSPKFTEVQLPIVSVKNNLFENTVSKSNNSILNENQDILQNNTLIAKPTFVVHNLNSTSSVSTSSENCITEKQIILLASNRELVTSKIVINTLRTVHKAEVAVMQLLDTDYIVSNRMAILRVKNSDFFSAPNIAKAVKKVKAAKDLYEKCCVIMEKDTCNKTSGFNKDLNPHLEFSLTILQNSSVKVLHSESQLDSAKLLYELADGEKKRKMHINVPIHFNDVQQQLYDFYSNLPYVSPICALNFRYHFSTLTKFIQASVEDLESAGYIGKSRARSIYSYVRANLEV